MSLTEILDFVRTSEVNLVEITGGEPLLQENVYPLMAALIEDGRTVLLETNGSIDLAQVPEQVVTIMDVKCPGSGMAPKIHLANLKKLGSKDELKFVLSSREDYLWAVDFLSANKLLAAGLAEKKGPTLLFSAVTGDLAPADLAAWILADRLPVRIQLQLHTLLWPAQKRGV